ncbi:MAG: hypothetical protein HY675_14625 [Chloroflexi bacterium]|nr:hypothetical protein [Chloroflexota bacterium]
MPSYLARRLEKDTMNGMRVAIFASRSLLRDSVASLLTEAGAEITAVEPDEPGALRRLAGLQPQLILIDFQAKHMPSCENLRQSCSTAIVIGLSPDLPMMEICPGERVPVSSGAELVACIDHLACSRVPEKAASEIPNEGG